jgi:hypothetical protein
LGDGFPLLLFLLALFSLLALGFTHQRATIG